MPSLQIDVLDAPEDFERSFSGAAPSVVPLSDNHVVACAVQEVRLDDCNDAFWP